MSIAIPNLSTNTPLAQPDVSSANATRATTALPTAAEARTELNASIVQASFEVSLSTQNEPLALLLKTAIAGINEVLKPEFGENALQNAAGQDNTPEGTAGRIVSLSTGFYDAYKAQHPGEDDATTLKDFMTKIRSGFEQGYKEASDILQGFKAYSGEIAGNVEKTYALVQQGYADFEAAQGADQGAA